MRFLLKKRQNKTTFRDAAGFMTKLDHCKYFRKLSKKEFSSFGERWYNNVKRVV